MQTVEVEPAPLEQLARALSAERAERVMATNAARARTSFGDRVIWHVNATAQGGGVAEMLQTLLAYGNGAEIENRWLVFDGDPEFFAITKRLHNRLHGEPATAARLGERSTPTTRRSSRTTSHELRPACRAPRPRDAPRPPDCRPRAGCATAASGRVALPHRVRHEHEQTDTAWAFLRPYLDRTDAFVFSRRVYAPYWVDGPGSSSSRRRSTRSRPRTATHAAACSASWRGGSGRRRDPAARCTTPPRRHGGLGARPHRSSSTARAAPRRSACGPGEPVGPAEGHGRRDGRLRPLGRPDRCPSDARRPGVSGVSDDPEGAEVLEECRRDWRALPDAVRGRVHLASIPMDDPDENAIIVNAVQRHAYAVVQKSLVEGFG